MAIALVHTAIRAENPMPKIHLFNSEQPAILGQELVAVCGKKVPNASAVFQWDDSAQPDYIDFLSSLAVCNKCWGSDLMKRYIYGIVPAQTAFDEQNPTRKEGLSENVDNPLLTIHSL